MQNSLNLVTRKPELKEDKITDLHDEVWYNIDNGWGYQRDKDKFFVPYDPRKHKVPSVAQVAALRANDKGILRDSFQSACTHNNRNMRDSEWSQAPLEVPPKSNTSAYYDDPADWKVMPWGGSPDQKPANMVRLVNKKNGRMTEWLPTGDLRVQRVAPELFNAKQHHMMFSDDSPFLEPARQRKAELAAAKAKREAEKQAKQEELVQQQAEEKALDAVEAKELPQSRKGKMAAEEFAKELSIFTADKTPEELFAIGTFRSKNGIFTVRFSPKRDDKGGWDDLPTGTLTSEQMETMKNTTGPKSQAEFNELYHSGGQRLQNLFANHLKMAESYGGDGKRILTVELPAWATKYMPTEMKQFYEQQIMDCSGGSSGQVEEWA